MKGRRDIGRGAVPALFFSLFLLAACTTGDSGPDSPVGLWEARIKVNKPPEVVDVDVLYRLDVGADGKCKFDLYWEGRYATGFAGAWALALDTLKLTAAECYKGDTAGVISVNDCAEDFPQRELKLLWREPKLIFEADSGSATFTRK